MRAGAGGTDGHALAASRLTALVVGAVVVDTTADVDAGQQRVALSAGRAVALGAVQGNAALGAAAARGRLARVAAVFRDAGAVARAVVVARALGCRRRDVEDGRSARSRRRLSVSWCWPGGRGGRAPRRRQARAAGAGGALTCAASSSVGQSASVSGWHPSRHGGQDGGAAVRSGPQDVLVYSI